MRSEPVIQTSAIIESPWAQSADNVVEKLDVSPEVGLDVHTVAERLRVHGPNLLQEPRRTAWWNPAWLWMRP